MTYYDYITQFEGAEHPFGDLASDIKKEIDSNKDPDKLIDIFEGKSFHEIYEHLSESSASVECMDTFVESWAAYLQHEQKSLDDPVPALILYQLSQFNEFTKYMTSLDKISVSTHMIRKSLEKISDTLEDLGRDEPIQIRGAIDTFEQN